MTRLALPLCALAIFALTACEGPTDGTYPITHKTCSADDPVKQMEPIDCAPHM
ncbi:hypothetical protein [Antarctobacter heliothermus]|uniref:Lipoprotein n=1 Tax=Antarctobacter heliothermus TaxID=74033 RepID=A0A239E108_9RHOB|nr:hypothetical protein [Antarctobacter heliothermus]SNS38376.1 hypothetical protein SAMN04488078_10136 [Antarctobacter heliothermus]